MRFVISIIGCLIILLGGSTRSFANTRVAPIPTPGTIWTSGESGFYSPQKGMICWGDKVGNLNGPVAVKFWKDSPSILIVYGACEISTVSVQDRAVWLSDLYKPKVFLAIDQDMPTATVTHTPSLTRTATVTVTSSRTATVTSSATRTLSPTQTLTPSETVTVTETETETPTATETETPTETVTPSETSTRTMTPTRSLTNTRTWTRSRTSTPTRTNTRTRTRTFTPSLTPTITVVRFVITHWDSKGRTEDLKVDGGFTCWGVINGQADIVVVYRVAFWNPEKINGGCQTKPWGRQNIVDIVNYWTRTTGRPWTLIYKP